MGCSDYTVPSGLPSGDVRHHPNLLPGRDSAHDLDFSSLRRYNGATLSGETSQRGGAEIV